MTRCPECSTAKGADVDHTLADGRPYFQLPPILVRFEHFLATRGRLGRPLGAPDPELPTQHGRVPSAPASEKHRVSVVSTLVYALTEMGWLRKGDRPGRWSSVRGRDDPRDLPTAQIRDYLLRRFPSDRCKEHVEGKCERCCAPHHDSMMNKTCEAFRQMGRWCHFSETDERGRPKWGKDKLREVYATARPLGWKKKAKRMNPVRNAHRFQEWMLSSRRPGAELADRARALYAETPNAAEVARLLNVPHRTVFGWVQGTSRAGAMRERIVQEARRAYGLMSYFGQEFGLRYEELVRSDYPLDGPTARLNDAAGVLEITGKGREGGKVRQITLTPARRAALDTILTWRREAGKILREHTGREADPVLFPTISVNHARAGLRRSDFPATVNRQLKTYAGEFNEWSAQQGHPEWALDLAHVKTHRLWRAVFITNRAKSVPEKVLMEEAGIEDHKTVEGYIMFDNEERRDLMAKADRALGGDATRPDVRLVVAEANGTADGAVLEELRALRKVVEELRAEGRAKDARIAELTDLALGGRRALPRESGLAGQSRRTTGAGR